MGGQVYDDLIGNNFLKPLGVNIHCETMTISATRVTSEGFEKDFLDLFKDNLGTFTGQPHHLVVDSGACPRAV